MEKKVKFGLFYAGSGKLVEFYTDNSKHSDEKSVANMLLKSVLKEENKAFNWGNIQKYLFEYAEYMNESGFDERFDHTPEEITSYVADNIVYCNAPHIIRMSTKKEVSNDFRQNVAVEIELMLDKALAYKPE
jgi:hypothetical protein